VWRSASLPCSSCLSEILHLFCSYLCLPIPTLFLIIAISIPTLLLYPHCCCCRRLHHLQPHTAIITFLATTQVTIYPWQQHTNILTSPVLAHLRVLARQDRGLSPLFLSLISHLGTFPNSHVDANSTLQWQLVQCYVPGHIFLFCPPFSFSDHMTFPSLIT